MDNTSPAIDQALRTLGRNFKIARDLRGFTQEELADRAGVGKLLIIKIEAGTPTSLKTVLKVAMALDLPSEDLFFSVFTQSSSDEKDRIKRIRKISDSI